MTSGHKPETEPSKGGSLLNPAILAWLFCSAAGGAIVATIEVGAVLLAIKFGMRAELGVIFTVALCMASIAGGVWVSLRNRMAGNYLVCGLVTAMAVGAVLVSLQQSVALTAIGCIVVGLTLPPLSTHYSLAIDALAPQSRRPEAFALLRTANSLGVIFAGSMLTWGYVTLSMILAALVLCAGASLALRRFPGAVELGSAERTTN